MVGFTSNRFELEFVRRDVFFFVNWFGMCVLIVARFLRWLSNAIGGHNRINEITDSIFLVLHFIIYSNGRERSDNGSGPDQAGTNQYVHTYGVKVSY